MLVEDSDPDNRGYWIHLDNLSIVCARLGTAASYKQGKAYFERARVAETRHNYLYGIPRSGKRSNRDPNNTTGFMTLIAHDMYVAQPLVAGK